MPDIIQQTGDSYKGPYTKDNNIVEDWDAIFFIGCGVETTGIHIGDSIFDWNERLSIPNIVGSRLQMLL